MKTTHDISKNQNQNQYDIHGGVNPKKILPSIPAQYSNKNVHNERLTNIPPIISQDRNISPNFHDNQHQTIPSSLPQPVVNMKQQQNQRQLPRHTFIPHQMQHQKHLRYIQQDDKLTKSQPSWAISIPPINTTVSSIKNSQKLLEIYEERLKTASHSPSPVDRNVVDRNNGDDIDDENDDIDGTVGIPRHRKHTGTLPSSSLKNNKSLKNDTNIENENTKKRSFLFGSSSKSADKSEPRKKKTKKEEKEDAERETRELLEDQERLQTEITSEMLELSSTLKDSTVNIQQSLFQDMLILSTIEDILDDNISNVHAFANRLGKLISFGFWDFCGNLFLVGVCIGLFIFTFMYMKIVPK